MTEQPRFIHLRVHSAYSLLAGAIHPKSLIEMIVEHDMPAVALSDTNNMFGALEFASLAKEAGVQPIIGCQFDLGYAQAQDPRRRPPAPAPIVLLAQSQTGYENLMALNSCLYLKDDTAVLTQVSMVDLADHSDGLICLTGGADGPLGRLIRDRKSDQAQDLAKQLAQIYPNRCYIEVTRHGGDDATPCTPQEALCEPIFLDIAYRQDLPLVATNDVYFPKTDMYEAHDALLCIADGTYVDQAEPRRRVTPEHYLKTPQEMENLFKDLPEAIENTWEIAQRCAYCPDKRDPILPQFAPDEIQELRRQAQTGLEARLKQITLAGSREDYSNRLNFELQVIENMGFSGYFLIVADFIKWAKDHNIPVGPGRGSGAGSLVAYALTITNLDPLRYDLLFERFLNPDRLSMPDFDIDLCMDRREDVIEYVQQKYGADRVSQIATFGGLLSKAAVRDIGRVLQIPYPVVDRLSKLIPSEGMKPVSIEKALIDEPRLREEARSEPVIKRMLDYAKQLEGLLRNVATHAAGVVIGDRPLDQLVPLYRDSRSDMAATQFNMKWAEAAGLVKFDFLGLKTLTVVRQAVALLDKRAVQVDIDHIPLDDAATYDLYSSAQTVAVFQVESAGMMDALRMMKPNCIEDIIALVALYRPGPMENIPQYCNVKNGRTKRETLHPLIDHILDETQGIIVYQEQVMQIAREMAGYTLAGADSLRRAMGKKIQAEMDKERPKFLEGALKNGVEEQKAVEVWNLLDKFANYGFNKSHAAAYGVLSYQTAWLKTNHPVEFMAAVMNCDLHLTDNLKSYIDESHRLEIDIVLPCVNQSQARFSVCDSKIVYGLGALKNVGAEAMELIVSARQNDGVFRDLMDFARRVPLKRIGKRPLEMLARAGAFDVLDSNRARVLGVIDTLVSYSNAIHEARNSNQAGLFGDAGEDLPPPRLPIPEDWMPTRRLAEEFSAVGFYLSGHPLDDYMPALRRRQVVGLKELKNRAVGGKITAKIAGVVAKRKDRKSAKGKRYAYVELSHPEGSFEVTVFSEALDKHGDQMAIGQNLVLIVSVELQGDQLKMICHSAESADEVVADAAQIGVQIFVQDDAALEPLKTQLESFVRNAQTSTCGPVHLVLTRPDFPGEVELILKEEYPLNPQIIGALKHIDGIVAVKEF